MTQMLSRKIFLLSYYFEIKSFDIFQTKDISVNTNVPYVSTPVCTDVSERKKKEKRKRWLKKRRKEEEEEKKCTWEAISKKIVCGGSMQWGHGKQRSLCALRSWSAWEAEVGFSEKRRLRLREKWGGIAWEVDSACVRTEKWLGLGEFPFYMSGLDLWQSTYRLTPGPIRIAHFIPVWVRHHSLLQIWISFSYKSSKQISFFSLLKPKILGWNCDEEI